MAQQLNLFTNRNVVLCLTTFASFIGFSFILTLELASLLKNYSLFWN
ncbi:hypothetical protein AIOL_001008 [Candidatus Rhodobacter oscarellae]|uniref:Uncharacterized protein n=1 Tax=Candidatus Rhodobacter oscarellae TaxID=1675527 RepID=A0A0J9H5H3_9RHOB|nr:hypothetical protein AIOL_001008 [Candidatus Rhodobacter lobularis]